MTGTRVGFVAMFLTICAIPWETARAQESCCPCGKKTCRLVCTEKTVTVTVYGCKCEDICVPGCGSDCTHSECVEAGNCSCRERPGAGVLTYSTGKPGCARQRSVSKLVKYEVTKKVPAYEWVVEDAGCECGQKPSPNCDSAVLRAEMGNPLESIRALLAH